MNMISWLLGLATASTSYLLAQLPASNGYQCHRLPSVLDLSIDDVIQLAHHCQLTSAELVQVHLERIAEVNDRLSAIIEVNPDALDIARKLDAEREAGHIRGPLHGIPIVLKANIATNDSMDTTAGSVCLKGTRPQEEATVVSKLREAGAVILGKSNLSEWAGTRSAFNTSTWGWSGTGGQSRGAYRELQDPGGSSSGSAVAVSIGLAVGALGTDTKGSIIVPAEWNNGVGIRPTLGLVSRHMIIPCTLRQDVVGPMTRTVRDAAYILSATAGKDHRDNYTLVQPFESPPDYVAALNSSSLQGARIGVPWKQIRAELYPIGSEEHFKVVLETFNASIAIVKSLGADILNVSIPSLDKKGEPMPWDNPYSNTYTDADFLPSVNSYLSNVKRPNGIDDSTPIDFDEIIACTKSNPIEEYPKRDISQWEAAKNTPLSPSSPEAWAVYHRVYQQCGPNGIFRTLSSHNLSSLILPTSLSFYLPSHAGSPLITVPMGSFPPSASVKWLKEDHPDPSMRSIVAGPGIPFGLAFLGAKWSEETLLSHAYAFEQATKVREKVRPVIAPRTELDVIGRWRTWRWIGK